MDATDLGLLVLRVVVGLIFAAHGAQKAFGWWGGPGPDRWRGAMVRMQFRPPAFWAWISTAAELAGGLLLAFGFLIPLATAALVAQSIVIIAIAHWAKGFWNMNGGFEFPLALLAGVVSIAATGPGRVSVDSYAALAYPDALRIALFLIGAVAGAGSVLYSRQAAARETAEAR